MGVSLPQDVNLLKPQRCLLWPVKAISLSTSLHLLVHWFLNFFPRDPFFSIVDFLQPTTITWPTFTLIIIGLELYRGTLGEACLSVMTILFTISFEKWEKSRICRYKPKNHWDTSLKVHYRVGAMCARPPAVKESVQLLISNTGSATNGEKIPIFKTWKHCWEEKGAAKVGEKAKASSQLQCQAPSHLLCISSISHVKLQTNMFFRYVCT